MGLILGTGVGGGLVLNGKSITGHSYITGEFGHIRSLVDALEVGAISAHHARSRVSWAALKLSLGPRFCLASMNISINTP